MLYSVDSVTADERFFHPCQGQAHLQRTQANVAEIDLSEWRTEYELADREPVVRSVGDGGAPPCFEPRRRRSSLRSPHPSCSGIPQGMDEARRAERRTVLQTRLHHQGGHPRGSPNDLANRQPFHTENARRLFEATSYGLRRVRRTADHFFWVVPTVPLWGCTSILAEAINTMVERISALATMPDCRTDPSRQ